MRLSTILTNVVILMNSALFDEEYTVGQAGLISWLRDNVGMIICWAISAIGFLIVAAAILRNALAGLYLAFPNMWDKVHNVRKAVESGLDAGVQGGEKVKKVAASFGSILLSMLPDVKESTDFGEDGEMNTSHDPNGNGQSIAFMRKKWLTKSIPSFLILCMIGMLIYYGYPTKLANFIGEAGRFGLDAIFDNVDPIQLANKVFDGINTYELATDSATSSLEKNINVLTRSAVKQVYTKYSDMQSQPLQETALYIESSFLNMANDCTELKSILEEEDGYTVSFMAQLTVTRPVMSDAFKQADVGDASGGKVPGLYVAKSSAGVKQFKYELKASELPHGNSQKVGANDWILVTVNATPTSLSTAQKSNITYVDFIKDMNITNQDSTTQLYEYTLDLTASSDADKGIYTTDGAHVDILVTNGVREDNESVSTTPYSGTLKVTGGIVTLQVNTKTKEALNNNDVDFIDISMPKQSYTMYEHKTNGVTINTKVSVASYRIIIRDDADSDKNGWINRNWNDFQNQKVQPVKELTSGFFDTKSSSEAAALKEE